MTYQVLQGDSLTILQSLPDNSVHCCITSPPYWGLRDYGHDKQIGLEPTPEAYVVSMVNVFREVRRVLRNDGTLWLNLGDTYNNMKVGSTQQNVDAKRHNTDTFRKELWRGLKPKDLIGIPWRVALALQADGWWLRQDIIWHKPNPMPESVTDRCTKSHEYVFLFAKSEKYYYDSEAVKEDVTGRTNTPPESTASKRPNRGFPGQAARHHCGGAEDGKRNRRSVWTITTKPFKDSHFAVMPEALVELCLLAGTSEHGCCISCGTPYKRRILVTSPDGRQAEMQGRHTYDSSGNPLMGDNQINKGVTGSFTVHNDSTQKVLRKETIGWKPGCNCENNQPISCVVLDPFAGSGTVGVVAKRFNRSSILIELNPTYIDLIHKRLNKEEK
jgi:DNA modification methylase